MDKEEFRIKLEEINHLVEQQDYKGAMDVVDSIDWRRVKNVRTLCVVGEIYAANKRYEDSKEIFLLAYHRAPIGKNILYRLIEVSLKMGDIEEAIEFYNEFREIAPNDNTGYILKYKIYKEKNTSIEELIKILEDYKEKEFTERWSYELAKLYYKAGNKEKCLALCDEMILWFSDGKYVIKALELKMRYGELHGTEKDLYEKHFKPNLLNPADVDSIKNLSENAEGEKEENSKNSEISSESDYEDGSPVIESIRMSEKDINGAQSIQEKITKGLRDIFIGRKKEKEETEEENNSEEKEEMVKDPSEDTFTNVPDLEPENGKIENIESLSASIEKMSLDIPDSMKNIKVSDKYDKPLETKSVDDIVEDIEKEKLENKEENKENNLENKEEQESIFSFNLEDTILAAATAQGIEIPDETQTEKQETESADSVSDTKEIVISKDSNKTELEEEEFLSEEDLAQAEDEFLNGPKETDLPIIPEVKVPDFKLTEDEENLSEEEKLEKFIDSIDPEKNRDPYEIVPHGDVLTEDEEKLFTYFTIVPGIKEQIVGTLKDVQRAATDKTSKSGNIIVMGGSRTGKTRLISSLIPAICKELNLEAVKVAYVFADQINGKDIVKIINKLAGGFFVIEEASQLDQNTIKVLNKAMEFRTDGLTLILEDEKISMRKLIAKNPKFAKKFTSIINIPVFTNDELVNFADFYSKEKGYTIDQMGMLALYNSISINQKEDNPMNIGTVKHLIDNAIAKSQGGILKFKKKKTDNNGNLVLHEKDFS